MTRTSSTPRGDEPTAAPSRPLAGEPPTDRALKRERVGAILDAAGASSLILTSAGALSWYLDGARVTVNAAADPVLAVVATRTADTVVVGRNEVDRLVDEELPADLTQHVLDWTSSVAAAAHAIAGTAALTEADVPEQLRAARASLLPRELDRYRALARDAAAALTDAMLTATPDQPERALAARIGAGLIERGAEPLVILVAGHERTGHRHPLPTGGPLGPRAMAVVCARRHGMIANVTRWVRFGPQDPVVADATARLLDVEADVFDATRPGVRVADALTVLQQAYPSHGFDADEWRSHHQGGPAGYVGRDPRASPEVPDVFTEHQAVTWNPSAPRVKLEDTVLITAEGIDVLSVDQRWPSSVHRGRIRFHDLER